MKKHALGVLLSCLAPLVLQAQAARLVKDINTIRNVSPASSAPDGFIRFGSRVFFAAKTSAAGRELWATDGTQAGTTQVADLRTGAADSNPRYFAVVNGTLVFNATDSRGEELWMSDGTAAGTQLLADISQSSSTSSPGDRILFRGKMLFSASDLSNGRELWITDATPAGTRLVKDITPGFQGSEPHAFVIMNDLVYFIAGSALWKTDGTADGTVKVKDSAWSLALTVAGSRIFFRANNGTSGNELWVSDGTEAGTHMVVDIDGGPRDSVAFSITAVGDRVLFNANDVVHGWEPWISDGTAAGTRMLRDLAPGTDDSASSQTPAVLGGSALFAAGTPATGIELWKTDGTEAGTTLVRDLAPGSAHSFPAVLTTAGNRIFFVARSGADLLLWVTDGTAAGTRQIPATESKLQQVSGGNTFAVVDGNVYFSGTNPLNGYEPWKSDGTEAGTSMIANLATDPAPSSLPSNLIAADEWIYFNAWNGMKPGLNGGDPRPSLWRSDGTPEGTVELSDVPASLAQSAAAGRSVFFSSSETLWISDGTAAGTKRASEFESRFPASPYIQFVLGDTIIVAAGQELWATTAAAGAGAVPLNAAAGSGYFEFAGRLFYFGADSDDDPLNDTFSLRTTDGTPAGTYTVARNLSGGPSSRTPAVLGGSMYFVSGDAGGMKLWRSDGTHAGTVVVKSMAADTHGLVAAGGKIFFVTTDEQLWVTDGTDAGTRALPAKAEDGMVFAAGNRVVFTSTDAATGEELWVSDGTAEGTRLLRDIYPGASSSFPAELTAVAGVVYLTAADDLHGNEVWMTDGTAEGTKLAADVNPGPAHGNARRYVAAGEQLFFSANHAETGYELWTLPLSSAPRLTIANVHAAEGSFGSPSGMARFTVRLSSASTQSVSVEYATADGTATAGSDYDAASGTLTFAAGETSKQIAVPVRGDGIVEGNESFFVTLRNAAGAALGTASAFAVIADDDLAADLALALDYSLLGHDNVYVDLTNHGPGTATNLRAFATETPTSVDTGICPSCRVLLPFDLPSGQRKRAHQNDSSFQQYVTFAVTAREHDPVPSNNSIGWTGAGGMVLDALYLTPGQQANLWIGDLNPSTFNLESSDPSVVSVPAGVTIPFPAQPVSVVVRGLKVGTATIRLFRSGTAGTLKVEVVAPGTRPRWPGALQVNPDRSSPRFDQSASVRIYQTGTAPFNGQPGTGLVTIKANGREVGRITLTPTTTATQSRSVLVPYSLAGIGLNTITVEYAGDDNFLPETTTWTQQVTRGAVTITGSADRTGTTTRIRLHVEGSPMSTPTGTLTIGEPGVIPNTQATLTATATPGVAVAELTLPNVPSGPHTLVITYDGDPYYLPSTQNLRISDDRRRSVRH